MIPENSASSPIDHPAWKLWSNPIFRRYCQSRLRLRGLGISLLVTFLITGFVFGMFRAVAISQAHFSPIDAEKILLIPLLVIQAVILFIFGTAQVAGGITAERDEGVIDYQRLIPMSPLAKVLGYVFGLPIREYAMFAVTLPFTVWSLWRGQVSADHWLPLYGILFTTTLLYHFTGLVTGTVVRNRRWAFLISIALIFALYTVVPQMAKFGLVFFKYLTVMPVFQEQLPGLVPGEAGAMIEVTRRLAPVAKFFNLDFSESVFTIFSQAGLIATFLIMLCRRWQRAESHLLGKLWAALLFIWLQVLLLGNALPLVETGQLFPSRGISRYVEMMQGNGWMPSPSEAVAMSGIYGLVSLLILFVLTTLITPSGEHQIRGWRRARKHGKTSLAFLSDPATSFWFTALMAMAGAVGWYLFTRALLESRWFPGHTLPLNVLGIYAAIMLAAGLGYQAMLEWKGGRALGLAAIFIGATPIMAGGVLAAIGDQMVTPAVWIGGISPISLPIYAAYSMLSLAELPAVITRAVPLAFKFWLAVSLLAAVWLSIRLHGNRKEMARKIMDEG